MPLPSGMGERCLAKVIWFVRFDIFLHEEGFHHFLASRSSVEYHRRSLRTHVYFVMVPFLSFLVISISSFVSQYQSRRRGENTWFVYVLEELLISPEMLRAHGEELVRRQCVLGTENVSTRTTR